jgi:hypothetical protein
MENISSEEENDLRERGVEPFTAVFERRASVTGDGTALEATRAG